MRSGLSISQRGFALLLMAAVALLLVVSVVSIGNNLGQGSKDSTSPLTQLINGTKMSKADEAALILEQSRPSMSLVGQRLHLADKTLTSQLVFELPPGMQDQLQDTNNNNAKVFACPSSGSCHLKPAYNDRQILLQLVITSKEANYEFQKSVPMKDIENSILSRVVYSVTIPLTGFPDLYPQDYYFFDVLMSFNLPNGIVRKVNGKDPTGDAKDFYSFDPGNVSESQNSTVSDVLDGKGKPADGQFHVSFKRKSLTTWYVYSVALIPLIFALLFLHLLFFSRHFQHKIFEEFTEALIVAILAVLPLRVVLVPVELEGLTRVDLLLSLGLVLIVGVAVGKYASEVWGATMGRSAHADHSSTALPESHMPTPAE